MSVFHRKSLWKEERCIKEKRETSKRDREREEKRIEREREIREKQIIQGEGVRHKERGRQRII